MITFTIDTLTPCLKETSTGEIYETEVIRLKRKSFLAKFNKRTGWYVNWSKFEDDVEVYALVLKGTVDVQGLVAVRYDDDAESVYIVWACTAPWNNKYEKDTQLYQGVGGHLLAVAADLSFKQGYKGYIYADALNENIYKHYVKNFHASPIGMKNGLWRFMIRGERTQELMEVYNYEWTEEEL